jgi:hypothetical protein
MVRRFRTRPYLEKRERKLTDLLTKPWVKRAGVFEQELEKELTEVRAQLAALNAKRLSRRASKQTAKRRHSRLKHMR